MTATNVETLAREAQAEPTVLLGEGSVTVTVRTQGAVYQATGDTPAEAARKILDALGA